MPFVRSKATMMSIPSISPNLLNAKFQALNSTNSKFLLNPAFAAALAGNYAYKQYAILISII
jgi:hypothetical protein